jgi:hypothetical protein
MFKWLILTLALFTQDAIAQDVKTYIPPKAYQYSQIVKEEVNTYFHDIPTPYYIPALIEHESCISLKHSRCWSPTSQLLSKRERGAGLGQLTVAYNEDGSVRFDALSDMVKLHRRELKDLTWNNILVRPDLQIRALTLMTKDNYSKLYTVPDDKERLNFADAAYNGGLSGVLKERMACHLAQDCNSDIWFNNVERYCLKSKKPLYGNRSACDINRHHVRDVILTREPKYRLQKFF